MLSIQRLYCILLISKLAENCEAFRALLHPLGVDLIDDGWCGTVSKQVRKQQLLNPWDALLVNGANYCPCALVSSKSVLCPGHCSVKSRIGTPFVVLSNGSWVNVCAVQIHPQHSHLDNDMAVVKLRNPVNTSNLSPVCLPKTEDVTGYDLSLNDSRLILTSSYYIGDSKSSVIDWMKNPMKIVGRLVMHILKPEECHKIFSSRIKDQLLCGRVVNLNGETPSNNTKLPQTVFPWGASVMQRVPSKLDGKHLPIKFTLLGVGATQEEPIDTLRENYILILTPVMRYIDWVRQEIEDSLC